MRVMVELKSFLKETTELEFETAGAGAVFEDELIRASLIDGERSLLFRLRLRSRIAFLLIFPRLSLWKRLCRMPLGASASVYFVLLQSGGKLH